MKKINKKIIAFSICALVIVAIVLVVITMMISKNENITTKMQFEYLGYNEYYDENENITVGEASKILTSIYAKIYDISEVQTNELENDNAWIEYAYNLNLVAKTEFDNELTKIRLYELLYDYEKAFNNVEKIENTLNLDREKYTENQIDAINFIYNNNLIKDIDINLFEDKIDKDSFEDIIVKFVFKFNLLELAGDKINYEESLKIKTDKNYFFVTNNSTKKELNYETLDVESDNYLDTKKTYSKIRNDVNAISECITGYFDIILNIDYTTIDLTTLYNNLTRYAQVDYDKLEEYYEYVKNNSVKISGTSNVIPSIIYSIDNIYYVRTRIICDNNNINLYGNIKSSEKYIDVPIGNNLGWNIKTKEFKI